MVRHLCSLLGALGIVLAVAAGPAQAQAVTLVPDQAQAWGDLWKGVPAGQPLHTYLDELTTPSTTTDFVHDYENFATEDSQLDVRLSDLPAASTGTFRVEVSVWIKANEQQGTYLMLRQVGAPGTVSGHAIILVRGVSGQQTFEAHGLTVTEVNNLAVRVWEYPNQNNTDVYAVRAEAFPDVDAPEVDAAGDIVDLADDYTNGQDSPWANVAASDDVAGIAHLGVSEVGGAELGGVDVECGTPRQCPLDVDEGFEVGLSSLGAGKRVLQATARDDAGKVGVSEPWTLYIDRQAPGAVTNVEASKIGTEPAQVYWTEPQDPALPDGSPGSGTTDFSYRYRVNLGAWSSWEQSDVSGITVPEAAIGSTIELQASSIDAVGNAGLVTTAIVTVSADDGSDTAEMAGPTDTDTGATAPGTAAADDEVYPPRPNRPTVTAFCTIGPGMGQIRFGRGTFDLQNAMRGFGVIRCWNNATNPRSAANVAASKFAWSICVSVPRPIPLLPIELGCRTTVARPPALPGTSRDNEVNPVKDLCVAGNRRYRMTFTVRVIGLRDVTRPGDVSPVLFRTEWDCNEAGAWRYLATRGRGSASFQLGNNITAPRCQGERCDALPAHGASTPRRGWQAHHIVPGGEGRNFENNTTAQASRAQTFAYSCNQRPNEPPNGAWLRGSDLRYPKPGYLALNEAERNRPNHSRIHTIGYYEAVADRLDPFVNADDTCADNDGLAAELQEVKREVIFRNFSGLPASSIEP